jgi:hypothetical protein
MDARCFSKKGHLGIEHQSMSDKIIEAKLLVPFEEERGDRGYL